MCWPHCYHNSRVGDGKRCTEYRTFRLCVDCWQVWGPGLHGSPAPLKHLVPSNATPSNFVPVAYSHSMPVLTHLLLLCCCSPLTLQTGTCQSSLPTSASQQGCKP